MNFNEAKKNLILKKQKFEDVGEEFKNNSYKREEFFAAKDDFDKELDNYEKTLHQLSKEEYDNEYKEALRYYDLASREYNPFVNTQPLQPGQDIPAVPFNPLAVASFRKDIAFKWTNIMSRNMHKIS